jgi:protein-S-isoprenylcysteine O-methyltransferase Ste14
MFRSKSNDQQGADKKSITLLWVTILVSISVAVFVAMCTYYPIVSNDLRVYLGVGAIFAGIIMRLYAVYSLGQFFTVDVTIREGHRLKTDGLFTYIRHPNYTALLISFLGIGITYNKWLSCAITIVPIVAVFIMRINIEERVLVEHFGDEYLAYRKETKRLVPFVY